MGWQYHPTSTATTKGRRYLLTTPVRSIVHPSFVLNKRFAKMSTSPSTPPTPPECSCIISIINENDYQKVYGCFVHSSTSTRPEITPSC
uniref:Uncharacterized protein n=1 Tax=Mesocestoides corti TaxID=53468 RepID=A0A5K3FQ89_MESCO